jgi:hypothetical protein
MCVFFHLNNSSGNKWFNFKISSWIIYTIIPFLACSLTRHLKPIVLEFDHVWSCFGPMVGTWFTTRLVFLAFQLYSLIFCTSLRTWLGPPHPLIASILRCVCTHPINPMGTHFLRYVHSNECTGTHDAIRDTFVTIVRDASFHMGWKQLHAFPSTTFNSSCRQVNIVLIKNGICTLVDVVIIDPMRVELLC